MIKKLNNKGYLLVEIILASVLAMALAYFMTNLTIKLKNKNDDILVKTLVSTDQAIIYNAIMKDLYNNSANFNCNNISVSGKKFTYKDSNGIEFKNIVSDYVTNISYDKNINCSNNTDEIIINIPIGVKQLPDDNFDVEIKFRK